MSKQTNVCPIDWHDKAVIEQLGMNIECLLEILSEGIEVLSERTNIPLPRAQAYFSGTATKIDKIHLQAIASFFSLNNADLLADSFKLEDKRESHWRELLKNNGKITDVSAINDGHSTSGIQGTTDKEFIVPHGWVRDSEGYWNPR